MKSRNDDMQALYNRLTEENKDILILVAKGMKEAVRDNGKADGYFQKTECKDENSEEKENYYGNRK